MNKAYAVIGANFGDEGKGKITDYLASKVKNPLVIRFNGGAQAGHTVNVDGVRHVFSHFGSGTLAGAPTLLSEYFIVNPDTFYNEWQLITDYNIKPEILIHNDCLVTTTFDILCNRFLEKIRGNGKHGSCGLGINETVTRSLINEDLKLTINDIFDKQTLKRKLHNIKKYYIEERVKSMGLRLDTLLVDYNQYLYELVDTNIDNIVDFYRELFRFSTIIDDNDYKKLDDKTIIFEGAQGLALDEDYKYFPHVTRSKTGLKNVVELAKKIGLKNIEAIYVTRWYVTRHGAGPLPHEVDYKLSSLITDKTNIPNPYQDTMRFGILDVDWLSENIENDFKYGEEALEYGIEIEPVLAITCLDQMDNKFYYVKDNLLLTSKLEVYDLYLETGLYVKYTSNGEERKNTY